MSKTSGEPRDTNDFEYPFEGTVQQQLGFLLNYAPLAPSHRNSQPWQFKLDGQQIEVYADPQNKRHCSDPFDRQKIISCGAAINTLEIAAAYFGHSSQVNYCIDENQHKLAEFKFMERCHGTRKNTSLFHALRTRQTNRGDFSGNPLTASLQKICRNKVAEFEINTSIITSQKKRDELARLTGFAVRELYSDPWYRREFVQSLRASYGKPKDGIYNYDHIPLNIPAPIVKPIVATMDISKHVADFFEQKIRFKSPTLLLLSSKGDSVENWLNTGRALNKLLLILSSKNLTASYINYAIEFSRLGKQLSELFGSEGKPQILLRIGVSKPVKFTGRHPISKV